MKRLTVQLTYQDHDTMRRMANDLGILSKSKNPTIIKLL
jgi:hypothetical protein